MRKKIAVLVSWIWAAGSTCLLAAGAPAEKQTTPEQLQQLIASAQTAHPSDDAVARQLAGVELTARVSPAFLDQLMAASPGPKTSTALRALVDRSALLDPPADDFVQGPAPDADAQKKMLDLALHYVARTLPSLPNFLTTRSTGHFNDAPMTLADGGEPLRDELHLVANSTSSITFRDGHEADGPAHMSVATGQSALNSEDVSRSWVSTGVLPSQKAEGLETHGEFGPILGIVLLDSAKGKVTWSHWEKIGELQVAVFQFAVGRNVSHYVVQYCCVDSKGASLTTGYHGTITLDPEHGTIYRIFLAADLHPDDPMTRAEMAVEYARVAIGNGTYICPVRSVSISAPNLNWNGLARPESDDARLLLNEVHYVDYHRFGSESAIIIDPAQARKP